MVVQLVTLYSAASDIISLIEYFLTRGPQTAPLVTLVIPHAPLHLHSFQHLNFSLALVLTCLARPACHLYRELAMMHVQLTSMFLPLYIVWLLSLASVPTSVVSIPLNSLNSAWSPHPNSPTPLNTLPLAQPSTDFNDAFTLQEASLRGRSAKFWQQTRMLDQSLQARLGETTKDRRGRRMRLG